MYGHNVCMAEQNQRYLLHLHLDAILPERIYNFHYRNGVPLRVVQLTGKHCKNQIAVMRL